MKNLNSLDRSNCIKVLISPDKNGFVCAIEEEIKNEFVNAMEQIEKCASDVSLATESDNA